MNTADANLVVPCPHCAALNRVPGDKLGNAPACGRCHQAMFTGKPLALDAAGFERHVGAGSVPVLVDTDAEPELGARYGIRSIPTLILFRGGREVARQAGAMSREQIAQWARHHGA